MACWACAQLRRKRCGFNSVGANISMICIYNMYNMIVVCVVRHIDAPATHGAAAGGGGGGRLRVQAAPPHRRPHGPVHRAAGPRLPGKHHSHLYVRKNQ